ncbi:MAG: zinc ribbon domain-containing protein [Cyclobacteriaceae bacterium]
MNSECSKCNTPIPGDDVFCQSCGYPERGTEDQQRSYNLRISSRKRLLADAEKKVSHGKTALLVLAGLMVLYGLIMFVTSDDVPTLISALILSVIYVGLAIWSVKNPFGAMLTGLIVYITLWAVDILIDPSFIYRGILIKIIIISVFIKGLKSAREARALMQQIPV